MSDAPDTSKQRLSAEVGALRKANEHLREAVRDRDKQIVAMRAQYLTALAEEATRVAELRHAIAMLARREAPEPAGGEAGKSPVVATEPDRA